LKRRILKGIAAALASVFLLTGCGEAAQSAASSSQAAAASQTFVTATETSASIPEDWEGDDRDGVAAYLEEYRKLPGNYMTKSEARKLGWEGGALHLVVPGKCIGGDEFGNYEELLPEDKSYRECDIDTLESDSRGAKRIIYSVSSDDLDIWYTEDHYESFDLLYGDGK
jgi:ribonuclease T1